MTRKDVVKIILALLIIAAAYIPTFIWMVGRWTDPGSYYSHAFLIPFISALMVFRKREELRAALIKTGWWGWILFLLAGALYLASALWQVYFTGALSLVVMLLAVSLLLLGKEATRIILAPIAFLFFMIPMPLIMIAHLSFRLKVIAAEIAAQLARNIGIDALRQGALILTDKSHLIVDEPCSGLRSLIALIALGALVAYYTPVSRLKKAFLLACSIPVAVIANVIRIFSLIIIAELYGAGVIAGAVHDITGYLVFVIAFVLLFLIARLLE